MFQKDRCLWMELDDEIIYFKALFCHQYMIFRNNQTGMMKYYFDIDSWSNMCLGLLNKQKQHLNVFMITSKYVKIARLYKENLKLKRSFRICKQQLSDKSPVHDLQNNLSLILGYYKWFLFSRNKQIRRHNGYYDAFLQESVAAKMIIEQVNWFRKEKQILNKFYQFFENIFHISIHYLNRKQGPHQFERKGDFLTLEISSKFDDEFNDKYYPRVFYLHLDLISKGQGIYGKFQMNGQESLEYIKQFDNLLYAVIKSQNEYNIYQIKSESKREFLYSTKGSKYKKPILQKKCLVLTNEGHPRKPVVYAIIKEDQKLKLINK